MIVIDFTKPTTALCEALSRFYAAKRAFATLVRDAASTGEMLSAAAREIHASEEALFVAIEQMRAASPSAGDPS